MIIQFETGQNESVNIFIREKIPSFGVVRKYVGCLKCKRCINKTVTRYWELVLGHNATISQPNVLRLIANKLDELNKAEYKRFNRC